MYIPKAVKVGEVILEGKTYQVRSPRYIVRKEKIQRLFNIKKPI
jgi:hypothetical protein